MVDLQKIFKEQGFSDGEKSLMSDPTVNTATNNQSRVISEVLLGKKIENAAKDIIDSNTKLSVSTEKYSRRMAWLTGALVFVGVVQIVIQIIAIYSKK